MSEREREERDRERDRAIWKDPQGIRTAPPQPSCARPLQTGLGRGGMEEAGEVDPLWVYFQIGYRILDMK